MMRTVRTAGKIADCLNIDPFQLALGSGDWQHIYAVPEKHLESFMKVAKKYSPSAASIGRFTGSKSILIEENGVRTNFKLIENDRIANNESFIKQITSPINFSENTNHD